MNEDHGDLRRFVWKAEDEIIIAPPAPEPKRRGRRVGSGLNGRLRVFTEQEERRLYKAADAMGPKYSLIIRLLFFTGMRVGELVSIKIADLNAMSSPHQLTIHHEKDGYSRDYDLPEKLWRRVERWLVEREPQDSPWLFPHKFRSGAHIGRDGVQGTFRVLCAKAGIAGEHSVHDARHTMATRMAMANDGVALISDRMGHRNVSSSNRYIEYRNNRLHDQVMVRRYRD